jgi:hypothetical protein
MSQSVEEEFSRWIFPLVLGLGSAVGHDTNDVVQCQIDSLLKLKILYGHPHRGHFLKESFSSFSFDGPLLNPFLAKGAAAAPSKH